MSAWRAAGRALATVSLLAGQLAVAADWPARLRADVERIDAQTPGRLGVYVKDLASGATLSYEADRRWYLSSSVKVAIAVAILQQVEAGKLALDRSLVLQPTDKIDGSGNVVWQKDGTVFSVGSLLERMLMQSDNTAANMLVRTLGAQAFDARARQLLGGGEGGRFTDFTRVRQDIYAELHPDTARLTNLQMVQLAGAPQGPARVDALRRQLSLPASSLKVPTMDEAYARYYAQQPNSATLVGYGAMLEKLVRGELLDPKHTQLMFKRMKYDTYDAYRLEAGLPRTVRFIHKTGTQLGRACHMGVVDPQDGGARAIVVAVCAEGLDEHREAGAAFEKIGRAITEELLSPGRR